ncbi:MAG: recombination protein RecR [Deltaproteobacteria bacterium]|nr:MAG: recombination protein RecR [Deltaproteobacteria bacterium]
MSDPITRLVQRLSRLPGIGEKTATRLALHIVRAPEAHVRELAQALEEVVDKIRLCSVCQHLTEADPCALCADARRDTRSICVVALPSDLLAIERTGGYRGAYHVLHGLLSPLEGIGPEDLRIGELMARLQPGDIDEVILALSANVEGEATAMYLARLIKPLGIRVTRIASGLPVGGELEYADRATIARALDHRSEV